MYVKVRTRNTDVELILGFTDEIKDLPKSVKPPTSEGQARNMNFTCYWRDKTKYVSHTHKLIYWYWIRNWNLTGWWFHLYGIGN